MQKKGLQINCLVKRWIDWWIDGWTENWGRERHCHNFFYRRCYPELLTFSNVHLGLDKEVLLPSTNLVALLQQTTTWWLYKPTGKTVPSCLSPPAPTSHLPKSTAALRLWLSLVSKKLVLLFEPLTEEKFGNPETVYHLHLKKKNGGPEKSFPGTTFDVTLSDPLISWHLVSLLLDVCFSWLFFTVPVVSWRRHPGRSSATVVRHVLLLSLRRIKSMFFTGPL